MWRRRGEEMREGGWDPKWGKDTEKEVLGPEANLDPQHHFAFAARSQSYGVLTAFLVNRGLQIFDVWKTFNKDGVWKPGSEAPG